MGLSLLCRKPLLWSTCVPWCAAVVLGACFSRPQPPALEPSDIASLTYPDVREWLETWMEGAARRLPLYTGDRTSPERPTTENPRRDDPRVQDVMPAGTPSGLNVVGDQELISASALRGCELELFPGPKTIQLHGIDSVAAVGDETIYVRAPTDIPAYRRNNGERLFRTLGNQWTFHSSELAEQAILVWRRAAEICAESQPDG